MQLKSEVAVRTNKTLDMLDQPPKLMNLMGINPDEKLMKIDSGLVNLKKNSLTQLPPENSNVLVHKFTQRSSVNFPVSILKSADGMQKNSNANEQSINSETNDVTIA